MQTITTQIKEVTEKTNPAEICTAYAHPVYGELTRLEWIYFLIYHMQRHTRLVKKIREAVSE